MKTYKSEEHIRNSIKKQISISYVTQVESITEEEKALVKNALSKNLDIYKTFISKASINDDDLFCHKSILVSTNWNANNDVFLPEVVWKARNTPIHKPTNLDHESSNIVGHMTGNWAISKEGDLIDPDTKIENLPSKYHILNSSVIYRRYHNDEEKTLEVENLISDIERGEQFVSMECSFEDFDYAIKDEYTNEIKILARNEDTAFLTKYLTAYGGDGYYNNKKIGRVLRDISFIGKAYTKNPANKESIIFTQDDIFDFAKAVKIEKNEVLEKNSVLSDSNIDLKGDNFMPKEIKLTDSQISELENERDNLVEEISNLKNQLAQANIEEATAKIEELTKESESLKQELTEANKNIEDLSGKLAESSELNVQLKDSVDQLQKEKLLASRISTLIAGGYESSDAEAKALVFENLNDDQFNVISKELIEAKASTKEAEQKPEETKASEEIEVVEETKEDSSIAEEANLDTAEVDELNESTASEKEVVEEKEEEQNKSVAALASTLTKYLKGDK